MSLKGVCICIWMRDVVGLFLALGAWIRVRKKRKRHMTKSAGKDLVKQWVHDVPSKLIWFSLSIAGRCFLGLRAKTAKKKVTYRHGCERRWTSAGFTVSCPALQPVEGYDFDYSESVTARGVGVLWQSGRNVKGTQGVVVGWWNRTVVTLSLPLWVGRVIGLSGWNPRRCWAVTFG